MKDTTLFRSTRSSGNTGIKEQYAEADVREILVTILRYSDTKGSTILK
jgi:hypothetical protein